MANEDDDGRLLVRLDERTRGFEKVLDGLQKSTDDQTRTLLAALETHANDDTRRFIEHDKRLKFLENWRWYVLGFLAAGGAVIALAKMVFDK